MGTTATIIAFVLVYLLLWITDFNDGNFD